MDRWVDKIAVVTGASSGIGAAIAKDLADRGVKVVALARRFEKLEALTKKTKGTIYTKQCDLNIESQILSVFRWIESTLGGVDILVNNAGVFGMGSLMEGDTKVWQQQFDTNVKALSICTREALKSMRQRGDNGHIFHINSVAGHRVPAFPNFPAGFYSATKHAVTALTEGLRVELMYANSKIKVTSISPGKVETEILQNIVKPVNAKEGVVPQGTPTKDAISAEDVSEALLYALTTRPGVQVHEIIIQPIGQLYS